MCPNAKIQEVLLCPAENSRQHSSVRAYRVRYDACGGRRLCPAVDFMIFSFTKDQPSSGPPSIPLLIYPESRIDATQTVDASTD